MRHVFIVAAALLLVTACSDEATQTTETTEEAAASHTTTQTEEEMMTTFTKQQGTITEVTQTEDGLFAEATVDGNPITFFIGTHTPVVTDTGEDTQLDVGMTVYGYVYSNSPMVMIYPPRYTPVIVVVETEARGFYDVASFNDELVNETNTLRIKSEKAMAAGDYAVFYTMTTRSIPAQTTPHRIIALTNPFTAAN